MAEQARLSSQGRGPQRVARERTLGALARGWLRVATRTPRRTAAAKASGMASRKATPATRPAAPTTPAGVGNVSGGRRKKPGVHSCPWHAPRKARRTAPWPCCRSPQKWALRMRSAASGACGDRHGCKLCKTPLRACHDHALWYVVNRNSRRHNAACGKHAKREATVIRCMVCWVKHTTAHRSPERGGSSAQLRAHRSR